MPPIKIAFVKFAGMAAGGTEKWLQMMAANLPKDKFVVDYYYCDAAPYIGSDYHHVDTDPNRINYMESHQVNLIKFHVGAKDITTPTHDWVDTDFWNVFDESKYDFVQTAKAGHAEYPFTKMGVPVVEYVTLDAGADDSLNIFWSIHLSEWQRQHWVKAGGLYSRSSVIPIPAFDPSSSHNLRRKLNIPTNAIVFGMHQRIDTNIFSPIPLTAFSKLNHPNAYFLIMGGSNQYRIQANKLGLKNVIFVEHSGNEKHISSFLNTLDVYAHGRKDGETFGTAIAEAMMHKLPCLSHYTNYANAQAETIGNAGFCVKNVDEYADKMNLFIKSQLRIELGELAAIKAKKDYSLTAVVSAVDKTYQLLYLQKKYYSLLRIRRSILANGHYYQKLGQFFMNDPRVFINRKLSMLLNKTKNPVVLKIFNTYKQWRNQYHSSLLSFKGHDSQYREKNKLQVEKAVHDKYNQINQLDIPELQLTKFLAKYPYLKETIVDIGSGTGWFSAKLSSMFKGVIAIEPSEAAIKIATTFYPASKYRNIDWRQGFAEKELIKIKLNSPTLFITATVLSHLPDQVVKPICNAINRIAPINSVLVFGECWGEESHEMAWHFRTKNWWQAQLRGWQLNFFGPTIQNSKEKHKGFYGIKSSN